MDQAHSFTPDIVPVLSAGRHRNPRRGACFMEFASYLAGGPWSDHPSCTHPALASLARGVNDSTADAERSKLAPLIPSVVGLTTNHPRADALVAVLAGAAALPIASEERQRAIATGLAHVERTLGTDEAIDVRLRSVIRAALDRAPSAERWARAYIASTEALARPLEAWAIERFIAISVTGIANACVDETDERLRDLLAQVIAECTLLFRGEPKLGHVGHEPASAELRSVTCPERTSPESRPRSDGQSSVSTATR
jgi:hypothetical protein